MAKTDFCRGCSKQNSGSSVMCVCGKQNVCDDCTNTTVCQECGNSCCKSCSFKVWCCGLVLCHAGNTQSCFSKHFTTRPCGHHGCNDQEECFKCHPEVTEEQVEAKKVASPEHPVASTKAPMEVSPPTARRPRRTVRSIYKRGEPMEEAESKKVKKRVKCDTEKVLPASSGNKQATSKPDKPVTHVIMTSTKCFFPQNLHAMITEIANVEPAVVSWIQGGEAFMIHDEMSAKLGEAMKKHFRHSKFTSLHRQLNSYGFIKHRKGKYKGAFQHKSFHRDRPEDLSQITRPAIPSKRQEVPKRTIKPVETNKVQSKPVESTVLSPNNIRTQKAKHLPAENQPRSKPVANGLKEKLKAMTATRPTLVWRR